SAAAGAGAWNAVFDGSSRRPAADDPVDAGAPSPSRRSGLRRAAGLLALPAGLKFLAPALPYAAGAGIAAGTWLAVRLFNRAVDAVENRRHWDPGLAVVAKLGGQGALWAAGGSLALHAMGLTWHTVAASLGIGGLAFSLAAKDFLGNLIQGVSLLADSPFHIGDRVRVDGRDLTVMDMTLRYVVMQEQAGSFTLVSYSNLASASFTVLQRADPAARPRPSDQRTPLPHGKLFWLGGGALAAGAAALGWLVPAALPYVYGGAVFAASGLLERLALRAVEGVSSKRGWSPTGTTVTKLGLTLGIYALGLFTGLRTAGVPGSSLLTAAGVIGVALGVAASDFLSALVQAVWLILARPFKVGDHVRIGDSEGVVKDMTLRYLVLESEDASGRREIFLPYGTVSSSSLRVFKEYDAGGR
ncbi:MAG: mechanosensitive ion channel, partial [Elusimicrobia bacterium]|nr:mechanosensitive ion channel [Elusimicrobiota bacterium]